MRITNQLIAGFVVVTTLIANYASAQNRPAQPTPSGQVPKASTGQQARPYAEYQPKPTGQIPQQRSNPPAETSAQPAGAATQSGTQVVEGQIPKANTSQDPRTFPERYQPATSGQVQVVIPAQEVQTPTQPAQAVQQQVQTGVNTQSPATSGQQVPTVPQRVQQPANGSAIPSNTQPATRSVPQNAQPRQVP